MNDLQTALPQTEEFRVSARSYPNSVAGALVEKISRGVRVELLAIGAAAVNQAVKAVAIARGFVAPSGQDLDCQPSFHDLEIDGREVTAIRLLVKPYRP